MSLKILLRIHITIIINVIQMNGICQYKGGQGGGIVMNFATNKSMGQNIYKGGNDDGIAAQLSPNNNIGANIYMGGNDDGIASQVLTNTNLGNNIYKGGNDDGIATQVASNSSLGINIYKGGNDDGFAGQLLTNMSLGNNIYKGGINDGWAMAIATNGVPLPVTIISFTAQWQANDALLIWKTATESNHSHFEVERSTDGINFEYIGRVNSAGNSSIVNNYHYSDLDIKNKLYTSFLYYRLKSVDKDGKSVYTAVVILQHSKKGNELIYAVYPNPAQQYIMIAGTQELVDQQITIRLMTLNGQVLQTKRMQYLQERIELAGYTAGQYLIQLVGSDHINFIQKIIKTNQP